MDNANRYVGGSCPLFAEIVAALVDSDLDVEAHSTGDDREGGLLEEDILIAKVGRRYGKPTFVAAEWRDLLTPGFEERLCARLVRKGLRSNVPIPRN